MTRIDAPKRRRRGAKRIDLTDMRKVLTDRRTWNGLGIVVKPEDGGQHYELVVEDGDVVDVLVEVEIMPDQISVSARLSGFAGGGNRGIWTIPAVGDEVIVALPAGQIDFQPAIVGVLSSGQVPSGGGQGPAEARTIIVNSEVLVHDGDGGAVELAKASELNDLRSSFLTHGHTVPIVGAAGTTLSTVPVSPPSPPDSLPTTAYPGTSVLKGK